MIFTINDPKTIIVLTNIALKFFVRSAASFLKKKAILELNLLIKKGSSIHFQDITHVINFDFPRNIEEYVHRVGRTGRAGKTGTSITFVERRDRKSAQELIKILEEAGQEVPDELVTMAERYEKYKEREAEARKAFGGRGFGGGGGGGFNGGGSFGGGGGRGGGGGDRGCFNCGQCGHISRNCPEPRRPR